MESQGVWLDRGQQKAVWIVHGLMFVLVTVLWWPALAGGKTIIHGDSLIHGLPLLQALRDYLHGGDQLLWANEVYGGHPLFAEGQGGFAQPLNLLVAWLLPTVLGSNVIHYLGMLIAGAGVIRLCLMLGRSAWAAGFAALMTVFSGNWLQLQHNLTIGGSMVWIPWVLVALEGWLVRPRVTSAVGLAVGGALMLLAGYPQILHGTALFIVLLLVSMACTDEGRLLLRSQGTRRVWTLLLAAALCLGLSAIQWLPLLELVQHSHRSGGTPLAMTLPLDIYLRGMLLPNWGRISDRLPGFGSVQVCLVLSLVFAVRLPWRAGGYLVAALVLLVLGMGQATPFFRLTYAWHLVPGLHFFRSMLVYLTVAIVGFAVVAAFVIDGLAEAAWRRHGWLVLVAAVLAWGGLLFWLEPASTWWLMLACLFVTALGVALLCACRREHYARVFLLVVLVLQCMYQDMQQLTFYEAPWLVPQSGTDVALLRPVDGGKLLNVSIVEAYVFLKPDHAGLEQFAERARTIDAGLWPLLDHRTSMNGALALQLHARDLLTPVMLDEIDGRGSSSVGARMIDLLDVRYITADRELHAPALRVAKWQKPYGPWVMENTAARGLVQTYGRAIVVDSPEAALVTLTSAREPQLVLQGSGGDMVVPQGDARADVATIPLQVVAQQAGRYVINIQAPAPCWLFVADANYPGWRASIDGKPVHVWTAQVLGKAVYVPAGSHRVVFKFRSTSFLVGLSLTLLTLLLMVLLLWRAPRGLVPWA